MRKFNYITPPDNFLILPFRFLSTIIVRKISKLNITPNQITIFRGLINAVSLLLFAIGKYPSLVIGFILFQIFEVLDHVDGDLARYKNMHSKTGELLECVIDTLGSQTAGLFGLCITIGIYNRTGDFRIFYFFIAVVLGRLLWLEFREPLFKWQEKKEKMVGKNIAGYLERTLVSEQNKPKQKFLHFILAVYTWRNQFILWALLLCYPIEHYLKFDPSFWALALIAVINHALWLYALVSMAKQKTGQKKETSP